MIPDSKLIAVDISHYHPVSPRESQTGDDDVVQPAGSSDWISCTKISLSTKVVLFKLNTLCTVYDYVLQMRHKETQQSGLQLSVAEKET